MFMARLRAEALSAGCFSSRRAVVRMEISVDESGGDRRWGMKSDDEKRLHARCSVVSLRG